MASHEPTPDLPAIPWKTCTKCGETKPETAFYSNGSGRLRSACKTCKRRASAAFRAVHPEACAATAKRHYAKNRDNILLYARLYRAANRAKVHADNAAWRAAHHEEILASARAYHAAHAEERRAYQATYREKNPDKVLVHHHRRKARKRCLPDTFTAEQFAFLRQYWHYSCAVCGNEEGFLWTLALDHWIPLGSPDCPGTIVTNMILLCDGQGGCNNKKHDKAPLPWLQQTFGPRKAAAILRKIDTYFVLVGGS